MQSRSMFGFISTKWPRLFFAITAFQAIICLIFESYVFARFQNSVKGDQVSDENIEGAPLRSIPTFLTLFIFGFLYMLVLVWDALRMKNTIQVIGVCIANLAMMVYTAIQIDQIHDAIVLLEKAGILTTTTKDLWDDCRPLLFTIPVIVSVCTLGMAFVSWKLYQEFAWDILKQIGADYRMKRRFLHYQIYIALLKFDFFFFLGFTVQFLVVVRDKTTDTEFRLTVVAIPVTIAILLFAAFFVRRENKIGMGAIIVLYFGALSYFFFKLVRIYQPGHKEKYQAAARSLTAFAVLTIILIILTIANAFICMNNFGAGLKNHLRSPSRDEEKPDATSSISMHDVKPQLPSRMTID
ncbi:hypothetical protein MCOR25_005197 [Pyricularia grisea]|nr:hypothetical protein MCOR25_005197 [Pyricularia grisea]